MSVIGAAGDDQFKPNKGRRSLTDVTTHRHARSLGRRVARAHLGSQLSFIHLLSCAEAPRHQRRRLRHLDDGRDGKVFVCELVKPSLLIELLSLLSFRREKNDTRIYLAYTALER